MMRNRIPVGGAWRVGVSCLVGVGALMALGLAGVPGAAQAQDAEPIKVGVMGPFTGPASRTGESIWNGARMALEDAKESGLVPITIDGTERTVELVQVDSESNPGKAVRAVGDAVNRQGVDILASGWHSSVAMAVMDAIAPMDIVAIGHGGESQYICEKINSDPEKYSGWFKGWASPPIFVGLYGPPLKHFMDQGLWKPATMKAAVLVEDTDFGRGWGEALQASLGKVGFDVVSYDVTPLDETEFTPLLAKYKALGVSVVGMTVTGSVSASNFVKQFAQQEVPALLIGHGLTWFGEWYELTGEASNYVITMDSPHIITPEQKEWVARYEEIYGSNPSIAPGGQQGYDEMTVALKVMKDAGSLDKEALIKAAHAVHHKGIWNVIDFAEEAGENALCPNEVQVGDFGEGFFFPLVQLIDGNAEILWPLKYSTAEFQAPPWLSAE